jgi:NADH:ubiquinone oxidoreductase subunit 2 (subunit N)
MYALLVIGGLNTVLSAVYYVKVLKVMILDRSLDDVEGRAPVPLPEPAGARVYAGLLVAALFAVGLAWDPVLDASRTGVDHFRDLSKPAAAAVARGAGEAQP